jgi:hypothetical protein
MRRRRQQPDTLANPDAVRGVLSELKDRSPALSGFNDRKRGAVSSSLNLTDTTGKNQIQSQPFTHSGLSSTTPNECACKQPRFLGYLRTGTLDVSRVLFENADPERIKIGFVSSRVGAAVVADLCQIEADAKTHPDPDAQRRILFAVSRLREIAHGEIGRDLAAAIPQSILVK